MPRMNLGAEVPEESGKEHIVPSVVSYVRKGLVGACLLRSRDDFLVGSTSFSVGSTLR